MSQEKNELFPIEELPPELIPLITRHLDKTNELATTNDSQALKSDRRQHFPIFRSEKIQTNRILARLAQYAAEANIERIAGLLEIRPDLRLQVLFTLAGLGVQDEMEAILKEHPEDLLAYCPLRDISGAEFEHITLFQHAVWAKDVRYMAPMMLKCLPQNEQGEEIRIKLLHQYDELIGNGVVYYLHGVKHDDGERHFSLQLLLDALRTYVDKYADWKPDEREEHWCTVVGLTQTLLPAHIRHHYCDEEVSFGDTPTFTADTLKRSLKFYNWIVMEPQLWCESLVGLGSNFGYRGGAGGLPGRGPTRAAGYMGAGIDLTSLTNLDEMRTDDVQVLKKLLDTPIQKPEEDVTLAGMKSQP